MTTHENMNSPYIVKAVQVFATCLNRNVGFFAARMIDKRVFYAVLAG